jgi:hypothetical protein
MRATFAALLITLGLSACNEPDAITRRRAEADAADPPQLWSIQDLDPRQARAPSALICADSTIRAGFVNQIAATNTDACRPDRPSVVRPEWTSTHCQMAGRSYAVFNGAQGDRTHDFKVSFSIRSIDDDSVSLAQTRRYRYLGPCPADWRVGDTGR